jgi:hypothetical protein
MKKNRKPNTTTANTTRNTYLYNGSTARSLMSKANELKDTLCLGFSNENWARASKIIREVEPLADLTLIRAFGDMMSEAYTHLSFARVEEENRRIQTLIKERTIPNT